MPTLKAAPKKSKQVKLIWKDLPLTFSEANHQYRYDKRVVPSVTTVLGELNKPALMPWAAKLTAKYIIDRIPAIKSGEVDYSPEDADRLYVEAKSEYQREGKKARDIGTEVHEAVELFLRMGKVKHTGLRSTSQKAIKSFQKWAKSVQLGPMLEMERTVYIEELDVAGKFDYLGMLEGLVYVVDVKTSNNFYEPDMPMQLSAYAKAIEECSNIKVDGIGIIRLDKETGEAHWRDYSEWRNDAYEMFAHIARFVGAKRRVMKAFKTY